MAVGGTRRGRLNGHAGRRDAEYPAALRVLHWLVVGLVVTQFGIAWTMPDIHRGTPPLGLVGWHLSVGLVILALMLVRLAVRLTHGVPPAPEDLPTALRLLSRATHYLLYALLLVIPFLGWANASARGWAIKLFGAIPIPHLLPPGSSLGRSLGDVHATLATVLLAVIALHVCGALFHALILRDGTVRRMTWG